MSTQIDANKLQDDYLALQEKNSNSYAKKIIEYYSPSIQPVLIVNLTRICSIVWKEEIKKAGTGSMSLPLYGPVRVDVLVELAEKHNTILRPARVQAIMKIMLQTLKLGAHKLPLSSIESCVSALEGEYINLLNNTTDQL